ncbi:MAG TPA: radical SAM protein [Gemmatimonadaceae bacterium]|jgi:radical SAM protein with 4Fe4S-binding SPASM domain
MMAIPKISAAVMRDRMVERARRERIPLQADIEIIATCNFKCVHCYIAPCAEREDVMSLEQATIVFDKLQAAGTQMVLLTGGEVFTHKQFKEIYLSAKRHGFEVYINTNAYLIGERWANFLAEWPPKGLSISLYGMSPESYERLTGIPKSYERVMRAIDLLLERGLIFDLKCPAMTITAEELPAMQAFARAKGIRFRTDYSIIPQEKGDAGPLQLQLPPHEVMALERRIDPELKSFRGYAALRVDGSTTDAVYKCGAGRTSLHINVHGGVSTCSTSRKVVGNLFAESFDDIWATLGGKVAMKYPAGHPCASCQFSRICAGCPATVEQLTGLPTGYVQMYCKMTHQRAHELGYHPTGVPRTVTEGIPAHVVTPTRTAARMLPVLA